jgi:hypothetical protein
LRTSCTPRAFNTCATETGADLKVHSYQDGAFRFRIAEAGTRFREAPAGTRDGAICLREPRLLTDPPAPAWFSFQSKLPLAWLLPLR